MKRAWLTALAALGLSCSNATVEGALLALVEFGPGSTARCVEVVVRTEDGSELRSGPVLTERTRPVKVGIARGGLPLEVLVYGVGYSDPGCLTPTVPSERTEDGAGSFKAGRTSTVKLTLIRRPNAKDDDRDGYASSISGGDDCDDADPAVHPGALEACGDAKDNDCDRATDCEEAACAADAGCSFMPASGDPCDDGNACTIADSCLLDAGCGGSLVSCPANECQVFNDQCSADGGCVFDPRDAGLACDGGVCNGGGSCIPFFPYKPSNFTESLLPTPAGPTTLDCSVVIDSHLGDGGVGFNGWCGNPAPPFRLVPQPDGMTEAVLLSFSDLDVGLDASVRLRGYRPVIFAATGNLKVSGELFSSSGDLRCADGGAGGAPSGKQGGGGAGFGSPGADGGHSGGAGGIVNGEPLLSPLRGGCPGGSGARGGGGLQLSAMGNLTITGTIAAPGLGGAGGQNSSGGGNGGNGAGSGGGVLLEGLFVLVGPTGAVTANGGSGGEGGDYLLDGDNGSSGRPASAAVASGGTGSSVGGPGGNGAAGTTGATAGGSSTFNAAGGGGAGLGRVRINSVTGCSLGGTSVLSPRPTSNLDAGCL